MYSGTNIDFEYKYRTISVEHLGELQEDIDKLRRAGVLSDNEVYRSYIDTKKFDDSIFKTEINGGITSVVSEEETK